MDEKEIEQFIENNIQNINQKISDFKTTEPNDTEIKNFLQKKLAKKITDNKFKQTLLDELKAHDYVKARIKDIANQYVLYGNELKRLYE